MLMLITKEKGEVCSENVYSGKYIPKKPVFPKLILKKLHIEKITPIIPIITDKGIQIVLYRISVYTHTER